MIFIIVIAAKARNICKVTQPEKKTLDCSHCHQPVSHPLAHTKGDNTYCCFGCMVVDNLLQSSSNELDISILNTDPYTYLDTPKIKEQLLDFKENDFEKITLSLPQIHCSSCIYLLENLSDVSAGILNVTVNFGLKQANLSYRSEQIKLSQLAALLTHIGYAPEFNPAKTQRKTNNKLLVKMGVAGFFFGNTMLLAFPEYFDETLSHDSGLQQFFRWLMLAFSLPVVLYSGSGYFSAAYKNLRAGILGIDLPIALGIATIFIRSAYEVISHTGAGYFDSLTGLIFFLLLGKWYQQKTYKNFSFNRDFTSFIPLAAQVLQPNGNYEPIPVADLKKGHIIRLKKNEVLPADALSQNKITLDYSYITGESAPVSKNENRKIFAGARVLSEQAFFEILDTADCSYLAQMWAQNKSNNIAQAAPKNLTDKLAPYFTPAILLIALFSALFWMRVDTSKAILVFTSVLIVACPCALALAEPFASGSLMRHFGKQGFFLKNTQVLERLAQIDHLIFDKTGTLTQLKGILVQWHGIKLSSSEKNVLSQVAQKTNHPLSEPLQRHLKSTANHPIKWGAITQHEGVGLTAIANADTYAIGTALFVKATEKANTTAIYVSKNGDVLGYFTFNQQTRLHTKAVLQKLQKKYSLSLLSGDNDSERSRFRAIMGDKATLLFNQSPYQKLAYVKTHKRQQQNLLMIGDGLNDAGALQQSDVGISICEKNINFFPPSDALLQAHQFQYLPQFLKLSQKNKLGIKWAMAISLLYNVAGLSFAVAGVLSPLVCAILMPVSSISVVLFTGLWNQLQVRKLIRN